MKISNRLILVVIVLIACVGCDQAAKTMAVSNLPEMKTFSYLNDTLRLQLTYNRGAFLSLGSSLPDALRHSIFTVGNCIFLLCALAYLLFTKDGTFPVVLAISLVIAGGVGNLIDRIYHNGAVVDFMNIGIGPLRTGIFNVADVAIMGGAILFIVVLVRKPKNSR